MLTGARWLIKTKSQGRDARSSGCLIFLSPPPIFQLSTETWKNSPMAQRRLDGPHSTPRERGEDENISHQGASSLQHWGHPSPLCVMLPSNYRKATKVIAIKSSPPPLHPNLPTLLFPVVSSNIWPFQEPLALPGLTGLGLASLALRCSHPQPC